MNYSEEMVSYLSNGKELFKQEINNKLYFIKTNTQLSSEKKVNYNPIEMEAAGFEVAKALKIQVPEYHMGTFKNKKAIFIEHFNNFTESYAVIPYGRVDRIKNLTFENIKKILENNNFEKDTFEKILEGALFDILIGNSKREKNSILFLCNSEGQLRHSGWVTNEVGFSEYREHPDFSGTILEINSEIKTIKEYFSIINKYSPKVFKSFMERFKSDEFRNSVFKKIDHLNIDPIPKKLSKNFLKKQIALIDSIVTDKYENKCERLFSVNYNKKDNLTAEPVAIDYTNNKIVDINRKNFNKLGPLWDNGQKFNAQFPYDYYQFKRKSLKEIKDLIVGDTIAKLFNLDVSPSYCVRYKGDLWYSSRDHYEGSDTYIAYRSSFVTVDPYQAFYSYSKKINNITQYDSIKTLKKVAVLDYVIGNTKRNNKNIFIKRDYEGNDRISEIKSNYAELKDNNTFKQIALENTHLLPSLNKIKISLEKLGILNREEIEYYFDSIKTKIDFLSKNKNSFHQKIENKFDSFEEKGDYFKCIREGKSLIVKTNSEKSFIVDQFCRLLNVSVQYSYMEDDFYIIEDSRNKQEYINVDPMPFYVEDLKGRSRFNSPVEISRISKKNNIKNLNLLFEMFIIDYIFENWARDFSQIRVFEKEDGLYFMYLVNNDSNTNGKDFSLTDIFKAKNILEYNGNIIKNIFNNKEKLIKLSNKKNRIEKLITFFKEYI